MKYVKILDNEKNPISFINSVDGVFTTINKAISNIKATHNVLNKNKYTIVLFGKFFNEYVKMPDDIRIEFSTINSAEVGIRALKPSNTGNSFSFNIKIKNIIDGESRKNSGVSYTVLSKNDQDNVYDPEIVTLILTGELIENCCVLQDLMNLLLLIESKTGNLQILTFIQLMKASITSMQRKIKYLELNLKNEISKPENILQNKNIQKLIHTTIDIPRSELEKTLTLLEEKGSCQNDYDNITTNATSEDYCNFLHELLFLTHELTQSFDYLLQNSIQEFEKINKDSYQIYRLKIIENSFKETIIAFNELFKYVHSLGADSKTLAIGENSSALYLNLTKANLKGPHRLQFRESLIEYLKKAKIQIKEDITDEELITTLRHYTSNRPDADYALVRFMKDHARLFTFLGLIPPLIPIIQMIPTGRFTGGHN